MQDFGSVGALVNSFIEMYFRLWSRIISARIMGLIWNVVMLLWAMLPMMALSMQNGNTGFHLWWSHTPKSEVDLPWTAKPFSSKII
jgi:hypothetical protein